jgi:hypothetical protein
VQAYVLAQEVQMFSQVTDANDPRVQHRLPPRERALVAFIVILVTGSAMWLSKVKQSTRDAAPVATAAKGSADLRLPPNQKLHSVLPNTYGNVPAGMTSDVRIRVVSRQMRSGEHAEAYTVSTYDGTSPDPVATWHIYEGRSGESPPSQ